MPGRRSRSPPARPRPARRRRARRSRAHYNGKIDAPKRVRARALRGRARRALGRRRRRARPACVAHWDFAAGIGPRGVRATRRRRRPAAATARHVREPAGARHDGLELGLQRGVLPPRARAVRRDPLPRRRPRRLPLGDRLRARRCPPTCRATSTRRASRSARPRTTSRSSCCRRAAPRRRTSCCSSRRPATWPTPTTTSSTTSPVAQSIARARPRAVRSRTSTTYGNLDIGLSTYDAHSDGAGVCFSSRLRPIAEHAAEVPPRHRLGLWQFPADLHLVDWLEREGYDYDVATDHDLHREGADAAAPLPRRPHRLAPRVLHGAHARRLAGLPRRGRPRHVPGRQRLLLGHDLRTRRSRGVIEVRKGESGSRAWQAKPGEYYHATTGERGGLWRSRGRAAAEALRRRLHVRGLRPLPPATARCPTRRDPRAAFMLRGHRRRRGDRRLRPRRRRRGRLRDRPLRPRPRHAAELAAARHEPRALGQLPARVRGDHVQLPGPGRHATTSWCAPTSSTSRRATGGGVFSTSSIAWCGSLSHNDYDEQRLAGHAQRARPLRLARAARGAGVSEKEQLTWQELGDGTRALAEKVHASGYEPDMILAIARGGLLVAGAMGYALGVKNVFTLNVEFYTGEDQRLALPMMLPPVPDPSELSRAPRADLRRRRRHGRDARARAALLRAPRRRGAHRGALREDALGRAQRLRLAPHRTPGSRSHGARCRRSAATPRRTRAERPRQTTAGAAGKSAIAASARSRSSSGIA